ncbi:MAG: TIM44-like domain-containing protein [Clostridiales bacterium]|nr:TIM44-like domain-containing protein [Clostridiales bacterium]
MKRTIKILIFALGLFLIILPAFAGADFGGFSGDSDYGGSWDSGSDWGSSSWDSGSDWSSSSWDSDYSSGSYYDDDSDVSGIDIGISLAVMAAIVVLGLIFDVSEKRKKKKQYGAGRPQSAQGRPQGAQRTPNSRLQPIGDLTITDPNFDANAMQEKISNLYVQMQNCWTDKNIESLRPYFTDALFTQMERQLNGLKNQGLTNYVDRIAVLGVNLRGFYKQGDKEHLIVELRTRIVDYTVQDSNNKLVSGDRNREKFMTYEWDMCRTSGSVTSKEGVMHSVSCPGCGAPLSINTTAKCPYCGRVVTLDEHDWALCAIKGIAQSTR